MGCAADRDVVRLDGNALGVADRQGARDVRTKVVANDDRSAGTGIDFNALVAGAIDNQPTHGRRAVGQAQCVRIADRNRCRVDLDDRTARRRVAGLRTAVDDHALGNVQIVATQRDAVPRALAAGRVVGVEIGDGRVG